MPATPGASAGARRDGVEQGEEIALAIVLVVGLEEVVDGMKEMSRHLPQFCCPSLNYTNEVI